MSPLVKTLLRKRNRGETNPYLQERINALITRNQAQAVRETSYQHSRATKKWWATINSITGRKSTRVPITSSKP